MTPRLPISLCLFCSTKGHFGHKDLYKATLTYLDRQVPLSFFNERIAHLKQSVGDETIAAEMETYLTSRGFYVIKTVADWSRGTVHQQEYLLDQRRVSMDPRLHRSAYMLVLEDDSPFQVHVGSVVDTLARSCQMLSDDHELLSVRFLRRGDLPSVPRLKDEKDWFYSPNLDLQPLVVRTRDWYAAHYSIELNWAVVSHLQCELLLRMAFAPLSRSNLCHAVWWPDVGETYHLGVENHAELRASLNL